MNNELSIIMDKLSITIPTEERDQPHIDRRFNTVVNQKKYGVKKLFRKTGYKDNLVVPIHVAENNYSSEFIISINPTQKVSFGRLVCNPNSFGVDGMKLLAKHLRFIFGEKYFNTIYSKCRVSRCDTAVDVPHINIDDIFTKAKWSRNGLIYINNKGGTEKIESVYIGATRSNMRYRLYNKIAELKSHHRLYPSHDLTRIESIFKSATRGKIITLESLRTIDNPFERLTFYKIPKDVKCSYIFRFFLDAVRQRGLQPALQLIDDTKREKYEKRLKKYSFNIIDVDEVWSTWNDALKILDVLKPKK